MLWNIVSLSHCKYKIPHCESIEIWFRINPTVDFFTILLLLKHPFWLHLCVRWTYNLENYWIELSTTCLNLLKNTLFSFHLQTKQTLISNINFDMIYKWRKNRSFIFQCSNVNPRSTEKSKMLYLSVFQWEVKYTVKVCIIFVSRSPCLITLLLLLVYQYKKFWYYLNFELSNKFSTRNSSLVVW